MKYKIEADGLSYRIYRRKNIFEKWNLAAVKLPLFDDRSIRDIPMTEYSKHRNDTLKVLKTIKQMDKILLDKNI